MQINLDKLLEQDKEPDYVPDSCRERNWNDGEFVERYLRGYLVLFNMNLEETKKFAEQFLKESKKNNVIQNKLIKEIKQLNDNFENILIKYDQLSFEFKTLRTRVETLIKNGKED